MIRVIVLTSLIVSLFCQQLLAIESTGGNSLQALTMQLKVMTKELNSDKPNDIKSFIKKYALPEDVKKMGEDKLDELVLGFIKKKKEKLRGYIIKASKMTPTISDDKLTYTYSAKENIKNKADTFKIDLILVYIKATGRFHIKN